jgi:transposase-like protein
VARRKRRVWRYSNAFHAAVVQRVLNGETTAAVARDVDVHQRLVRAWVHQAKETGGTAARLGAVSGHEEPQEKPPLVARVSGKQRAEEARQRAVLRENQQLKQALAEKTLEVDFFKGALQKVAARRQQSNKPGETASTPRSGK